MSDAFGVDFSELGSVFDSSNDQKTDAPSSAKKPRLSGGSTKKKTSARNESGDDTDELTSVDIGRAERLLQQFVNSKKTGVLLNNDTDDVEDHQQQQQSNISEVDLSDSARITIHTVDTGESACTHEVALPPSQEYESLKNPDKKPAKTYPFQLDPFQKEAILCLENLQSVLVSAHTSAGKTVVGEYAIAMSLQQKQRVIYTTPIKALSNQKYREFYDEFRDVGLLTGDVTINPNASCLIMTTEILRSMLYRGSEVMREVGWVIFDEIHYMRDQERGVVWEETIILLPDIVHYVFLSATIPNASQFAEWICALHKQPCHVVYTDYRPTPLQHYMFPCGGDGLHLCLDEAGVFHEDNFNKAMSQLVDAAGQSKNDMQQRGRRGGFKGAETHVFKIVKLIMERNLEPCIVFSFSKKECEIYALQMAKLDFNTAQEKLLVEEVFANATSGLSDDDKKLPQVESVLPLLKKGIGIHHGGLLPLLKETIEILFHEGLIKCLFATETFAMGLNMPARTVLFTSARKYDGKGYRWVTSGEYIQMSGRAGRRGLDDKGTVILMIDESMGHQTAKNIIKGLPDSLNSAFHLTYNMILNLLRVEEINPEYMLERSFFQFQNYASLPDIQKRLVELEKEVADMSMEDEESVASYYQIRQHLKTLTDEKWGYIRQPKFLVPFLQPGRLVHIVKDTEDFGWSVVINISRKQSQDKVANPDAFYVLECLLKISAGSAREKHASLIRASSVDAVDYDVEVIPVKLDLVCGISSVRVHVPNDLRPRENRLAVLKSVQTVNDHFSGKPPLLNPRDDMKIKDDKFKDICVKVDAFQERLDNHWLADDERLSELLQEYEIKVKKQEEANKVKEELSQKKSLLQMDELKHRKRVLRRLGYASSSDVIELKGRVACEIDSADTLVLTELLFNGIFNDLTVPQTAALLSCFVFEEKSSDMPNMTEELVTPLRALQETARKVARVSLEAKITLDADAYVEAFKPHMMDIVAAWADGASFSKLCSMTDIFEGSIIRCMRRLEELLRQMCSAAKAIGNSDLENKFAQAIVSIKRDIVFAASLYL